MTLRESEPRSPSVKPKPKPKPKPRPKPTKEDRRRWVANAKVRHEQLRQRFATDDDAILTFGEWIALNSLSERQGRRILADSGGPVVTMITDTKIGISRGANRAWLASRSRSRP
jgi:hypothetical protein